MSDESIWLLVVLGCLVALWFLSEAFRSLVSRILGGRPALLIEELPSLVRRPHNFAILQNPKKRITGARSRQAVNDTVSIIYHVSRKGDEDIETIDIARVGRIGMIFTLVDGRMVSFERIGSPPLRNPRLTVNELTALNIFMAELHHIFKE